VNASSGDDEINTRRQSVECNLMSETATDLNAQDNMELCDLLCSDGVALSIGFSALDMSIENTEIRD
jgi:hypothetical protein